MVKIKFLPVMCFMWFGVTFFSSYAISVALDHVYPLWPYISETGTLPPESCFLSFMFSIGSVQMFLVVVVRFRQILLLIEDHEKYKCLRIMNVVCLIEGTLGSLGICVVGNVQMSTVASMHTVGVFMVCVVGSLYLITHAITCIYLDEDKKWLLFSLRILLCLIILVSLPLGIVSIILAIDECKCKEEESEGYNMLKWNPSTPGYYWKLVSSISEWALTFAQGFYILSFYPNFRNLDYNIAFSIRPQQEVSSNENQLPKRYSAPGSELRSIPKK